MPKKSAPPKGYVAWAVYDKDDGRISYVAEPEGPKPRPGYNFQAVTRVRVTPVPTVK